MESYCAPVALHIIALQGVRPAQCHDCCQLRPAELHVPEQVFVVC